VPRLVTPFVVDNSASRRLVVNYFASAVRPGASARRAARHAARRRSSSTTPRRVGSSSTTPPRAGSSSTTSPPPRVQVPRHGARLVAPLIVDYFAYTACPGASAHRAARHTDRRVARRRLLCMRRASGCLGTSRGSPLVVNYFAYAARPGASARRAARCATRRRLLRLRRVSECLGTSRGPSRGSSFITPCAATSSCDHDGSTSATPCVVTTCLAATLALLRVRHVPPRRRLLVASRRPFILTSFPS
jgi:hypothetical protein